MTVTLGIRREDKNRWERRVPLIPQHIQELHKKFDIKTIIQPSPIRIFPQEDYLDVDAIVKEDLSSCNVVFAIKEIPLDFFEPGKTYAFFSHTIKGQKYNMPMLKKMMDLGCTLIDYERIADENGRRLVFFGRYAGLAGMIDTLWAFGQRLKLKNIDTPFSEIKQTIYYHGLHEIKQHLAHIRKHIETRGLPDSITPLICGFAGYGNVSKGAQEIFDLLPVQTVEPDGLASVVNNHSNTEVYKVVFKEKHMVEPISSTSTFELQDYYQHPENYQSKFERYVPYLSILMNCIYWNTPYPRLVTKEYLKHAFKAHKKLPLQIIGDISVDINGAIECTSKTTTPDNPVFVYNPLTDTVHDGYRGEGVVVMAVDNLPCELPRESSTEFSNVLHRFVPAIMKADFTVDFSELALPPTLKKAVILYKGQLTPDYQYINKFL
jgi:alpha-aminoadipic semialdehyde synthase